MGLFARTGNIIDDDGYGAIPDVTWDEGSESFLSRIQWDSSVIVGHDPIVFVTRLLLT